MILKNGKRIDGCSDTVPIGSLNPFLGTAAPYGYLICAGQLASKVTYPELYAICGDTYGTATATEFYLPDLRGRTIVGYKEGDTNFGTLGGLVGSVTSATGNHTLTAAESGLPSHFHAGLFLDGTEVGIQNGSSSGYSQGIASGSRGTRYVTGSTGGSSASSGHNHGDVSTIQPSINLNWIVKAFMLMPNQSYVANTTQESSVNTYSCDYINDLKEQFFNFAHPIGSYYWTSDGDFNPSTAGWYGTWVEDNQGRGLISRGTPVQNNNTNHGTISSGELGWNFNLGDTLGEYNHQLTTTEMPAHRHQDLYSNGGTTIGTGSYSGGSGLTINATKFSEGSIRTGNAGGDGVHNNIHPITVGVCWHRIA